MELEPSPGHFEPVFDRRPLIPEPLPVRLVAIEDVELPAACGLERDLLEFYVDLLGFEREGGAEALVLRAENVKLRFAVSEPPLERESLRILGIEVDSLARVEPILVEREIPFTRERALNPGQELLVLRDPAGNWISISQVQPLF
jgi:hypothetical protein